MNNYGNENRDPRNKIELINLENLYQIKDANGQIIDYKKATGKELFNHYRHNMTNYDEVLDEIRLKEGHVNGYQQKKAVIGAAEKVLEKYHEEHIKVIEDSQEKKNTLKKVEKDLQEEKNTLKTVKKDLQEKKNSLTQIFNKAKVNTASALVNLLDNCAEQIKKIGNLENSQKSLQEWNDNYRVQRELVKKLIKDSDINPEIEAQVKVIFSSRSVNQAIDKGCKIFDLEKSEISRVVKSAIRYNVKK